MHFRRERCIYIRFFSLCFSKKATSLPGSFPWLGGGAGKGFFPPHPQARQEVLGTRLVRRCLGIAETACM